MVVHVQSTGRQPWCCISVTSISRSVGPAACLGLPGMHLFSMCESTSQFLGHCKNTAVKCLGEGDTFCCVMTAFCYEFTLGNTMSAELKKTVCIFYNCPQFSNTNEVRNYKWNRVRKDTTKLTRSQDSLKLHLSHANYQAAVWKRCFRPKPHTPSLHGHGWDISDGVISIGWMTQLLAPEGILDIMKCGCKSAHPCSTRRCGCRDRNMQCVHSLVHVQHRLLQYGLNWMWWWESWFRLIESQPSRMVIHNES